MGIQLEHNNSPADEHKRTPTLQEYALMSFFFDDHYCFKLFALCLSFAIAMLGKRTPTLHGHMPCKMKIENETKVNTYAVGIHLTQSKYKH